MALKQLGRIDSDLLGRVDKCADWLGQTRRVFTERALRRACEAIEARREPEESEAA